MSLENLSIEELSKLDKQHDQEFKSKGLVEPSR